MNLDLQFKQIELVYVDGTGFPVQQDENRKPNGSLSRSYSHYAHHHEDPFGRVVGPTESDKGQINRPEHYLYAQKNNDGVFAGDHPAAADGEKYCR
jgi:hypothetical protein